MVGRLAIFAPFPIITMKTFIKRFPDNTAYIVNARSENEAYLIIDSIGDPTDYGNSETSLIEIDDAPWMIEILPDQSGSYNEYLPAELEDDTPPYPVE